MDDVDAYCERLAPGLWAEPLNAVSNAAFLIAAALLWWRYRPQPKSLRALPVLLALVGLGSLSFHTLADTLTSTFDVGFIAVYVIWCLIVFTHYYLDVRWALAWLAAPAFVVLTVATAPLGGLVPGGSGIYLAPFLALLVIAALAWARGLPWHDLARAAGVFVVSVTLRTLDQPLCGVWPSGTHYFWHLLNAVVLFLVARELIRSRPAAVRT
ncbi:hypothetical protein ALI22I_09095 [Saccharothrix sp. ALI-22-I]|uniref:hypothetical protein n=1 Tax=Saccharothrix sp. ALI-22-I TaxID=1933778 RepID=UPI00097BD092|nr:hypothetical protein [Saccharothrix sp. ALI-22-I]ONI91222.1 hypothetical protein ALI22I_09095 [Saccharothrix sp. ALI-22-I]